MSINLPKCLIKLPEASTKSTIKSTSIGTKLPKYRVKLPKLLWATCVPAMCVGVFACVGVARACARVCADFMTACG